MWKYTHTDEMYHSLTNKEELFHSDTYLGQDFSDGIKHFKYIKREKVNGKWRYYYKDAALDKIESRKNYNLAALREENKRRGYGDNDFSYVKVNGKYVGQDKVYQKLSNDAIRSSSKYANTKYKSDERKKKYDLTIKGLNTLSDASYTVGKTAKKVMDKVAPKVRTEKTYVGDKVVTTKYVNGKKVSETTGKNDLTEKRKAKNAKEAEREKKKKKIKNKINKGKKAVKNFLSRGIGTTTTSTTRSGTVRFSNGTYGKKK